MSMRPAGFYYRSRAAAVVILVTLVAGGIVPGTWLDGVIFRLVAGMVDGDTVWTGGEGSRENPWGLRVLRGQTVSPAESAPVLVWVGEDPEGIFQTSPPSPVDYAVMFSNMGRLGVRHAACAVVLAWDEPDMIGLMALERTLGGFESVVMAAPVSRGAVGQPLPQAFRRASLPLDVVEGDVKRLPLVNRVPVADVWLGGDKSLAGFSVVESEEDGGHPFVCARWDDRVVLSFALCAVAARLGVGVEAVEVRLGEYVRIGRNGPMVAIDERGRMRVGVPEMKGLVERPAEGLVDAKEGWLPEGRADGVILADGRGFADAEVRRFSRYVAGEVAAVAGEAGVSEQRNYVRLPVMAEWLLTGVVAMDLAVLLWLPVGKRWLGLAVIVGLGAVAQILVFLWGMKWLPGAGWLAAVCVAGGVLWWPRLKLALMARREENPACEAD
jgi:hypothetical protein